MSKKRGSYFVRPKINMGGINVKFETLDSEPRIARVNLASRAELKRATNAVADTLTVL